MKCLKEFCDCFNISTREKDVVLLLLEGVTNNKIAEKLLVSSHTVRRHLNAIYKRTNVHDRISFLQKIHEFKNS